MLTPALSIVKTANASTAVPGQSIGYTVTITNSGQTPYTGAVVTDSFADMADDAVYNGDATATAGSLSFTSPNLTWTGDLAVGASAVITYSVTVNNPDTGDKLVINTVSSTATGSSCPPGSTAPACRVTVPVLTPALTIVKTAATTSGDNAVANPGGVVTYTVTVTDSGQTPYTGAAFTDPLTGVLDDATYNNDAAATTGTVSYTSPTLSWTGNLAVGATATITYTVTVNNPDTGSRVLANTVDLGHAGQQLPCGRRGRPLRHHGDGGRRGQPDLQPGHRGQFRGGRRHGALHDHGGQFRGEPLHRREFHRSSHRGAGRRRLQQRRRRHGGHRHLHQP